MLVVLLTLAGCGGDGSTAARCPLPLTEEVARVVGEVDARLVERATGVVTCSYHAGDALRARVTVDEAPQAATRFLRTVVETGQAHLGDDRSELPQMVRRVGVGANWFAARRELLATAGDRLVTVAVPSRGDRGAAIAIARAALRGA